MATTRTIRVPLNRVEGDLEITAELEAGRVVDAFCSGTMYRGIERILVGRGALDGLVITPRVCGICTTSHLHAAARALDAITHTRPPGHALRVRNVAQMFETVQSDLRHSILMFAVDLVDPLYRNHPYFPEVWRRFRPFEGESAVEVVRETKRALEVVAILGGQWPHSSFMVPGGVTSLPGSADLVQCRLVAARVREWYERRVLGCPIGRWQEVGSAAELDAWLEESAAHRESDLGLLLRAGRAVGMDRLGGGYRSFMSVGGYELPEDTAMESADGSPLLQPSGIVVNGSSSPFDQSKITESLASSWYLDDGRPRHPSEGRTEPYASGREAQKYSWAKAPRYDGQPFETGPLAEAMVAGDPLVEDLVTSGGPTVLTRQLARLTRPARLLPVAELLLAELTQPGSFYRRPDGDPEGEGHGLLEATRGALGHWVKVSKGVIEHYQIVTPTAWNASPRDASGARGPIEEALVGTELADPDSTVALGHVVRSFDPCLVCTVHAVRRGRTVGSTRVGASP